MLKTMSKLAIRAMTEFLILASILGLIGYFVYHKMDSTLKSSLEESVALQANSIAVGLRNQFEEKFHRLEAAASLVSEGKIKIEEIDELFLIGAVDERIGIVDGNNEVIRHEALPEKVFEQLKPVLQGEKVVIYDFTYGLVFAVPVKIDDQVCIMYNQNPTEWVRKTFHAVSYNGTGTIILLNGRRNGMILANGEKLVNLDYEMQIGWDKISDKWKNGGKEKGYISVYHDFRGESYFLYLAEIFPKYNFAISGYVPWRAVAVGIDYIYMIMAVTFFIVLLMILFAVRSFMKSREAEKMTKEKIMADSANKAKSEFLSNMSHEIRTPINAIMGMNEMVIRESKDENILEYSANLQNAARTLLGLVNDILDFSKIEAGKMEIIPVEYHVSSLLNDLVHMIESRAAKKDLYFKINVSETMPSVLFGDEIRIKQIITNILTNAVKYTEQGGVTLNVTYRPIDEERLYFCVSVSDTGIGIKKRDLRKLFSAFERIEEERNRTIEGTGLGMNITQKLLEMMGSRLHVESVYGKGSTFAFQVEQRIINGEPIGNFQEDYKNSLNQHKEYHESFTAPNANILVVDDTVMNLTVVKGLLKQTKIKIDTALNGTDCLTLVARKKYDIIFLDHRMPGMDGIETLAAMKKIKNNPNIKTPVISLTANAISGAKEQYLAAGFEDYITKPINSTALENMIVKYLPDEKVLPADESENTEPIEDIKLPEWLTKVEGLDINAGVENCGSAEAYLDALTVFAESIIPAAGLIENYYKSEDWKNYTTKVHALKSTAKVVGAAELSEKAKRLEDAGNSGYVNEIRQDTEPLLQLYRSYAKKLESLIHTDDANDEDKPLITDYDLAEAFDAMKDAAATFDYDTLMFVFESLDEYRLPEKEAERYKKIKNAAADLNWEEIKKLL